MRAWCLWLATALICAGAVRVHAQEPSVQEPPPTEGAPPEPAATEQPTSEPAPPAVSPPDVDTGVIFDPELEDTWVINDGSTVSIDATEQDFVPTGDVRVVLQSRVGADLVWPKTRLSRSSREDVVDATQIMLFETHLRRGPGLRFAAGLRARHQIATRRWATSDSEAVRHTLDVSPTAAYADITVSDGVHVRAGYQVTRLGRFDLFSATNMLAVADLRSGAASMPDAVDVAQPALRLDWDVNSWLNVQAIHVPFFQPHIVDYVDGDYAMFKTTQADIEGALDNLASMAGSDPTVNCNDPINAGDENCVTRARIRQWLKQIPRNGTAGVGASAFGAFGVNPSLADPQGAIRTTARGASGELSLTLGTALEHLPSLVVDKSLQDALRPDLMDNQRRWFLGQVTQPFDVEYNRYYVVSVDGAMPVGPVQLGFETAYMFNRTLYSAQTECDAPPGADCVFYAPAPEQTDMLHGALRVELAQDETLLVGLETFVAYAVDQPRTPDKHAWLTLMDGRYMMGAALMTRWSPLDTGWTFEFSGVALNGPTVMLTPRIQWQAAETLFVELGAIWIEGAKLPSAPNNPAVRGTTTRVDWAIGGIYTNVDQVFAGLKWMP